MAPDSISERANSKIFLGEHASRLPSGAPRVLHVRLAPPPQLFTCSAAPDIASDHQRLANATQQIETKNIYCWSVIQFPVLSFGNIAGQ